MNKFVKICYTAFLLSLYILVIGLYSSNAVKINTSSYNNQTENTQFSARINAVIFFHTPQIESLVNVFNNLPSPNFKNSIFKLVKCNAIAQHFLNTSFSKYQFFSINILLSFFKTDIIFPFHYFW